MVSGDNELEILAVAIVAAAAIVHGPWSAETGDDDGDWSGSVRIASLENEYPEPVNLAVHAVAEYGTPVDGTATRLTPDAGATGGLVACEEDGSRASELAVHLGHRELAEPGPEETVPLEPGDCRPGGGAVFEVVLGPAGNLTVLRRV